MPRPTVAPMMLALGLVLLAAGAPFGLAFLVGGAVVLVAGLGSWVGELLPGAVTATNRWWHRRCAQRRWRPELATVEQLRPGMPGYRARLPEEVHPLSAGIKGGIVGGLVMPMPALALRRAERPRHLVSDQPAGRHGRAGRRRHDRRRSSSSSAWRCC